MIETEQQRRWWFATHPEYSRHSKGGRHSGHDEEKHNQEKVPPEQVDAYVDDRLKHATGLTADFLKAIKRWFGTEGEDKPPQEGLTSRQRDEIDYQDGWNDGYKAIRSKQAPPDVGPEDDSAYARGLRQGAFDALDELEEWAQKWDPLTILGAYNHSRTLGKNLKRDGIPKPTGPDDYDAHHLVPWNHWRVEIVRDKLLAYGIDIDSIENGMWLERSYHQTLANNYKYLDKVKDMLMATDSKSEALEALARIRDLLATRTFPL